MSDFSNNTEAQFLDALFNGSTTLFTVTLWIALFEDKPDDDGVGTELSGNGYARTGVTTGFDITTDGDGNTIAENNVVVTFPQATGGDWNEAKWWGAFSLASGGIYRCRGLMVKPITVLNGNTFQFGVGSLSFQAD